MKKSLQKFVKKLPVLALSGWVMGSVHADTIAYWRFEGDGVTTPTDGDFLRDTDGRSTVTVDGIQAVDSSTNGNLLYTWDNNGTGHQYRNNVPFATVPQTGQPNLFSIQNNGNFPASFTWSPQSSPGGINIDTMTPAQWTIEVSVRDLAVDGAFRTFVGREGNGVTGVDANLAPVYFQVIGANQFAIKFADAVGNWWEAVDSATVVQDQWYNLAAVSDGLSLKLFKDSNDGFGYQLVAETVYSDLTNTSMINPGNDLNGDPWGWTVGRGRYGNNDDPTQNHGDRWFGNIDEVRISNAALRPGDFLFAQSVPEPGAFGLLLFGGLLLMRRIRS